MIEEDLCRLRLRGTFALSKRPETLIGYASKNFIGAAGSTGVAS